MSNQQPFYFYSSLFSCQVSSTCGLWWASLSVWNGQGSVGKKKGDITSSSVTVRLRICGFIRSHFQWNQIRPHPHSLLEQMCKTQNVFSQLWLWWIFNLWKYNFQKVIFRGFKGIIFNISALRCLTCVGYFIELCARTIPNVSYCDCDSEPCFSSR